MLTVEKLDLLSKPLKPDQHGWVSGNPFLKKSAIRDRLNQVDPAWSAAGPEFVARDGDTVFYRLTLTICGVSRAGLGSGIVQTVDESGNALTGFKLSRMVAKAHKQAASDALPRAALEFGVGAYLKDKPRDVKPGDFPAWLTSITPPAPHWAHNGGGGRVSDLMKRLELKWPEVSSVVEPGHTLTRLSDTSLSEVEFIARLLELLIPAAPKAVPASKPAPVEVVTKDLAPGDVVKLRDGRVVTIVKIGDPVRGLASRERHSTVRAQGANADMSHVFTGHDTTKYQVIDGPRFVTA